MTLKIGDIVRLNRNIRLPFLLDPVPAGTAGIVMRPAENPGELMVIHAGEYPPIIVLPEHVEFTGKTALVLIVSEEEIERE